MKHIDDIERRVLGVCWLHEDEMHDLLVKDLVWKEGWLYAVCRWRDWSNKPLLNLLHKDSHRPYEKYIWMGGEHWVPVITGQEQVLLQLIEGRNLDDHVFPTVHMPSRRVLWRLKRQYASRLYTMFTGLLPPIDNRRFNNEEFLDVNYRYDEDAIYDIVQVLYEQPGLADFVAWRYVGRRSPRRKKGENTRAVEKHMHAEHI